MGSVVVSREALDWEFQPRDESPLDRARAFHPLMVLRAYPVEYLYRTLSACGFREIEISVFATASNDEPHPCVMTRKVG